jgi:hypothetical protein
MRQHLLLTTAAAVAVATAAVIALPAFAETRSYSLSGFDRIDVSAGVDVTLNQGPFSVKADERNGDFDRLIVEVRGNTLHVSRKTNWLSWNGPDYSVTVSAPNITEIGVSSGAALEGHGLSLKDLEVSVSSGADVELTGACAGLRVDISSGADFDGEGLKCETASVDASSGADADAFATRSANGDASSGADITFHGKPADFTKDTSSGGSVRAL